MNRSALDGSGRRNDVKTRLVLAPGILAGLLAVLWLSDRTRSLLPAEILLVAVAGAASLEAMAVLSRSGVAPASLLALTGGCLVGASSLLDPSHWPGPNGARLLVLVAWPLALLFGALRDLTLEALLRAALLALVLCLVALPLAMVHDLALGPLPARRLAWILLIIKGCDMGGWLVGRFFGRHRIWPKISPGKSFEGTAGGLLLSVLVALMLPSWLGLPEAAWSPATRTAYGLLLAVGSLAGGLIWSSVKRRVGVKDSGALLPHMGGFMDLVDSLIVAVPLAVVVECFR